MQGQGAVASEERETGAAEVATPQRLGVRRERRQRALALSRRPAAVVPRDTRPQFVATGVEIVDEAPSLAAEAEQLVVELVEPVQQVVSFSVTSQPVGSAETGRDAGGKQAPSVDESRRGRFCRHEHSS